MRPTAAHACPLLPIAVLLAGLAGPIACNDPGSKLPAVAAAPRVSFELYGVPGPWWRDDATQADFDQDIWACRAESSQARDGAPSETRKDVAYRAFLDCMTRQSWTRGHPPPADG